MKDCLLGYSQQELIEYFAQLGEKPFRAKQVYGWLQRGAISREMRNLPASLQQKLSQTETAIGVARSSRPCVPKRTARKKYLFSLADGNVVEGVLMRYHYGNTLCISSQVGCRMGCAFCASTLEGRVRDMTAGEMMGEVIAVNRLHQQGDQRGVTNIVMMGSGEPMDNYDNVLRFLHLVSAPEGAFASACATYRFRPAACATALIGWRRKICPSRCRSRCTRPRMKRAAASCRWPINTESPA